MTINYEKYNSAWADHFNELKTTIESAVSNYVCDILHVGSTSIKGMSAKPIIDIDIIVENFTQLEEVKSALSKIEYDHIGDQGVRDREVFVYTGNNTSIGHHLYLVKKDSIAFRNHLYLKRHLENNPDSFTEYQSLKQRLASNAKGREEYWRSKTEFILNCLREEGMPESELAVVRAENLIIL